MDNTLCIKNYGSYCLFKNIVLTKLTEAQKHLKKLKLFWEERESLRRHRVLAIAKEHEDQFDFISTVQNQCKDWRNKTLNSTQKVHINDLENSTHQLEEEMNAIIYIADKIIISSDSEDNGDSGNSSESVDKHTYHELTKEKNV
jgi:hypothetical protein